MRIAFSIELENRELSRDMGHHGTFLKEAEGITRKVSDQPGPYSLDNNGILDAIETVELHRTRAVAAVDAKTVTDAYSLH
jgi:hypothetical protein